MKILQRIRELIDDYDVSSLGYVRLHIYENRTMESWMPSVLKDAGKKMIILSNSSKRKR
jgi:hypothetical protein